MEIPTNMKCYQYGNIRMFHGDCMEFMQGVPDKHYELAIVDPPYGIGFDGESPSMTISPNMNKARFEKWRSHKTGKYQKKEWDRCLPVQAYWDKLFRASENQIIWGGNHFDLPQSRGWIFWDKLMDIGFSLSDGELAWTSFNKGIKKFTYLWAGFKKAKPEDRIHPTQKPVALYRWLLENYAKPGDKILDTHGGSGSIVIACHALGFALDWIELDEDYYEAAVKRFKQYLGKPEEMDGTKFDVPPQLKMFTE